MPGEASQAGAGIDFEVATGDDLEAIVRLNPSRPAGYVQERLDNRETCYVARSGQDRLSAYLWVAPGKRVFRHRSRNIAIDEGDVYIRDVLTLPENRGRGLTPAFLGWIDGELAAKGYRTMWAAIKCLNYSSQRSFTKAGYRLAEKIHFAKLPFLGKELTLSQKRGRP